MGKEKTSTKKTEVPKKEDQTKDSSKKRRREKVNLESLPPEERARREQQRILQQRASDLRSKGLPYKRAKEKQRLWDAKSDSKKSLLRREHAPRKAPQILILPIYWQQNQDEMTEVLKESRAIETVLRNAGFYTYTDLSNEKTPGQKMRAWEEKGVLARIEIGPKDAAMGNVTLAIMTTPGEVAMKTVYKATSQALMEKIREVVGAPRGRGDAEAYHAEVLKQNKDGEKGGQRKTFASDDEEEEEEEAEKEEEEVEEEEEPAPKKKRGKDLPKKKAGPSGDDLGDAFAIEFDAAEDEGKKKKKKSAKKEEREEEEAPAWDSSHKKRAKVVKF